MKELHDRYFRQAKREGRLARSFYKLEEIDRKTGIIKPGMRIIDIGASPGSWLEYILEKTGGEGVFCAVDLKVIAKKFKGVVHFYLGDVRDLDGATFGEHAQQFDAVVSDMAPNTSGIKLTDQARSLELCEMARDFALQNLAPGGSFTCKIFDSPEVNIFRERLRPHFKAIRTLKPDASRDESIETYIVCTGFGQPPEPRRERRDHELRKTKGKRTRQY